MRNALAHVPQGQHTRGAAVIRQAFLQPDAVAAHQTWRHVADQLRPRWPKLAALMDDSEHDVLAHMAFPARHRTKLHSTNPNASTRGQTAGQRLPRRKPGSSASFQMRPASPG
jgi:putative transposase